MHNDINCLAGYQIKCICRIFIAFALSMLMDTRINTNSKVADSNLVPTICSCKLNRTYPYTCTCAHRHTHTMSHTHTYIHIHTHTHTLHLRSSITNKHNKTSITRHCSSNNAIAQPIKYTPHWNTTILQYTSHTYHPPCSQA